MFKKILGCIFLFVGITIITGFDKTIETKVIEKFDISHVEQSILEKFVTPKENQSPIEETKNKNTSLELNVVNPYPAPEITLTEWINSHPLMMKDLRGKVVIIDFWTYSCINCQRTLPYLVKWDKKYRDK
jgi:thiol-disulfide isomerase/thioredoxin